MRRGHTVSPAVGYSEAIQLVRNHELGEAYDATRVNGDWRTRMLAGVFGARASALTYRGS